MQIGVCDGLSYSYSDKQYLTCLEIELYRISTKYYITDLQYTSKCTLQYLYTLLHRCNYALYRARVLVIR